MKKALRTFATTLFGGVACAALVTGALALTSAPAQALRPIGPLCGPTYQWSCSGPGGPDVLFVGTICDKIRFESKTGLTCVPF